VTDPGKIVWVLVNLLANAVRFTLSGGHVSLSGERVGGQVQLAVTDDGQGVPVEVQPRIFDKFVQVKAAAPWRQRPGTSHLQRDCLGPSRRHLARFGAGSAATLYLRPPMAPTSEEIFA
jgi:light-regulated signal transduction histidine kinase (bacteriophytochrome)